MSLRGVAVVVLSRETRHGGQSRRRARGSRKVSVGRAGEGGGKPAELRLERVCGKDAVAVGTAAAGRDGRWRVQMDARAEQCRGRDVDSGLWWRACSGYEPEKDDCVWLWAMGEWQEHRAKCAGGCLEPLLSYCDNRVKGVEISWVAGWGWSLGPVWMAGWVVQPGQGVLNLARLEPAVRAVLLLNHSHRSLAKEKRLQPCLAFATLIRRVWVSGPVVLPRASSVGVTGLAPDSLSFARQPSRISSTGS